MTMTPDEIDRIMQELALIKERLRLVEEKCTSFEQVRRMMYILLGIGLGSGLLTLSQVVV